MSATQVEPYLQAKIDYTRAITRELVKNHKSEWQREKKKLVSAVLFGPLAADEYSEEIWLFEVVDGYPHPARSPEPQSIRFASTRAFPMFGHLRLWVMSPAEFKAAVREEHAFIEQLKSEPKEFILDTGKLVQKQLK